MKSVSILMGSKSDYETVKPAITVLKKFGVNCIVRVLSAHRTPDQVHEFVKNSKSDVFVCAAGKAAHLAGVVAAFTVKPVIGLPVQGTATASFDSLLSMVQMPAGIPVATVAVNGAENAGLLAIQILAVADAELNKKLLNHRQEMAEKVLNDDAALQQELDGLSF